MASRVAGAELGPSGRVVVAWSSSRTRALVRRSLDGGGTWLAVQVLDAAADGLTRPWLAVDGNVVIVGYGGRSAVRVGSPRPALAVIRRSGDGGATWQPRRTVSAASPYDAFDTAVTGRGSVVRVAYALCTTTACGRARLWYRQTSNAGLTWSTPVALTGASVYAYPSGVAATSRILVLYDALASASMAYGSVLLRIR